MHPIIQYLLNRQEIHIQKGDIFFHGGFYQENHKFLGHSWFAKDRSYAAGYVTFGAEEQLKKGRIPYLTQFVAKSDFVLLSIDGSHVKDLYDIYGRAWNHSELVKDTAEHIHHAHPTAKGLFMSRLDDYLILEFENQLTPIQSINDLENIRKIKHA